MAYAHARGVIHRDLKPANIMVGAFGEVQVMDWGLAKVLAEPSVSNFAGPPQTPASEDQTYAGQIMGTPAYMAPEQARGDLDKLDERADVFGLGALLCEILTGTPPYSGEGDRLAQAVTADLTDAFAQPRQEPNRYRFDSAGENLPQPTAGTPAAERCGGGRGRQCPLDRRAGKLGAAELERTAARTKAAEERKRRQLTLGLAVALFVLIVAGGGGGIWWWEQRFRTPARRSCRPGRGRCGPRGGTHDQGPVGVESRGPRLGNGAGSRELRKQVQQAHDALDFVTELDSIRLRQSRLNDSFFDFSGAEPQYVEIFRRHGFDMDTLDPIEAARRIADLPVHEPGRRPGPLGVDQAGR